MVTVSGGIGIEGLAHVELAPLSSGRLPRLDESPECTPLAASFQQAAKLGFGQVCFEQDRPQ